MAIADRSGLEFSAKVRDQAAIRANGRCERCGDKLKGSGEFDHILPAAYGGKPVLMNCHVLCRPCHVEKTGKDVRGMRKADRQRRNDNGAELPTKQPIKSRGFARSEKPKREQLQLPDRKTDAYGISLVRRG